MPKLKAALASHQHAAHRALAVKRREAHEAVKNASIKSSSSGQKKAKKRAKLAQKAISAPVPESLDTAVVHDADHVDSVEIPPASTAGPSTGMPLPLLHTGKGKSKATIPFTSSDTILLLGEANFSYALSLVVHHAFPAHQLLATSYDPEEVCYRKYPDARGIVSALRERGAGVEFGVDGGKLEGCKKVGKGRWSRVIMNFPHTGSGIKDQDRNIRDNQLLLLRVLRSVAPVLTRGPERLLPGSHSGEAVRGKKRRRAGSADDDDDGEGDDGPEATQIGMDIDVSDLDDDGHDVDGISNAVPISSGSKTFTPPSRPGTLLITLLDQPPYTLWSLKSLATRPPHVCPGTKLPQPKYMLLRSFRFETGAYPGYAHRRTLGFKEGVSKDGNEEIVGRKGEARTWEFAPARKQRQA